MALLGSKITRWSSLRALGNSSIAKATIVVPIVGYLLILNQSFLDWVSPSHDAGATEGPLLYTHAWRLVAIYYGLTSVGLATALFGFFCPPSHKKYPDGIDYALGVYDLFATSLRWTSLANMLVNVQTSRPRFFKWVSTEDFRKELTLRTHDIEQQSPLAPVKVNGQDTAQQERSPPNKAFVLAALRTHYALTDVEKPMIRLLTFVFYAVGIALVTASALWGIAQVTATVLGRELPASPLLWLS